MQVTSISPYKLVWLCWFVFRGGGGGHYWKSSPSQFQVEPSIVYSSALWSILE